MSVQLIKLVTGEEILCTAEYNATLGEYTIEDALAVVMQPGETDPRTGKAQMAFAFVPWGTMVDGAITIKDDKVIYAHGPEEQVLEHYNKMFGRIQTPPKGLVIAR